MRFLGSSWDPCSDGGWVAAIAGVRLRREAGQAHVHRQGGDRIADRLAAARFVHRVQDHAGHSAGAEVVLAAVGAADFAVVVAVAALEVGDREKLQARGSVRLKLSVFCSFGL